MWRRALGQGVSRTVRHSHYAPFQRLATALQRSENHRLLLQQPSPHIHTSATHYSTILPHHATTSSSSTDTTRDIIHLHGMVFHAHHGYYQAERDLGQRFIIDLDAYTSLAQASNSDSLEHTINYHTLYTKIEQIVVQGRQYKLLESLGEHICLSTLSTYPTVQKCVVRLRKPHVAIDGVLDYAGVTLIRTQDDMHALSGAVREHNDTKLDEHSAYQSSDELSKPHRIQQMLNEHDNDMDEADRFEAAWQKNIQSQQDPEQQERLQQFKDQQSEREELMQDITGKSQRLRKVEDDDDDNGRARHRRRNRDK